jgi:arabinogalactan endo-1,4-beta-galactosidase
MKIVVLLLVGLLCNRAIAADPVFFLGGDISALPDMEKFGAVYRDHGKAGDCITILRDHGCNLFRVRLFVNPTHDFDKSWGATQDLPRVLELARRIKTSGAKFSLAIHYSDTWADPKNQTKPEQWKDLPIDALQQKVADYTVEVMRAMKTNGTVPDIVEVGNETTHGMLWPDGKLDGKTNEEKDRQWEKFARLLKAGVKAVRSQSTVDQTRVLIHIDGGGKAGVPRWYFDRLKKYNVDYDIIGLSFYPIWNDSLDELKTNLKSLSSLGKDVLIIETAYPHGPGKMTPEMKWPATWAGQKQFLADLTRVVKDAPDHRGIGVVWWYPEALPIEHHKIWEGGLMGWFDGDFQS